MQEGWVRWEPIKGLSNKYDVKSLLISADGLMITLSADSNESHTVKVAFVSSSGAYRQTNDQSKITLLSNELSQRYGEAFLSNWTFFKIENSAYLAWLEQESCTWSTYYEFNHFCLLGKNSFIDIAARLEPDVKIQPHKD